MKKAKAPSQQLSLLDAENQAKPFVADQMLQKAIEVIRVESVLSKLPMHCLSKREAEPIQIQRTTPDGKVDLLWEVSPNMKYGMPGIMAYQIDTLVINKRLDEAKRPVPPVLRLGTLRAISQELGLRPSGTLNDQIRMALYQCAGTMITAKLTYTTNQGQTRRLEAGFRRYDVIFSGDQLPDGREADAVYIVPGQIYAGLLNEVPVRPLDFSYLKATPSPSAQRWYEVASFKVYAALRNNQDKCWLDYSEYCLASGQKRYDDASRVQKQMYKIHRSHIKSGYILDVRYEATLDRDDCRDWRIKYTIGPRAIAEFREFNRTRREPEIIPDSRLLPAKTTDSEVLVNHFLTLRFGGHRRDPSKKELIMAEQMIQEIGLEKAKDVIQLALERATLDSFSVMWMTGISSHCTDILLAISKGTTHQQEKKITSPNNSRVGEPRETESQEVKQSRLLSEAMQDAYEQYCEKATGTYITKTYTEEEILSKEQSYRQYWRKKYTSWDEREIARTAQRSVQKELGAGAKLISFEEFQKQNAARHEQIITDYLKKFS